MTAECGHFFVRGMISASGAVCLVGRAVLVRQVGVVLYCFGCLLLRLFCEEGAVDACRDDEYGNAGCEQADDGNGAEVDGARCLCDDPDEEGAEESGAFAEDVEDSEETPRLFGGDDLREVGARERLNAALEESDDTSKDPELPGRGHEDGEEPDARIDADRDEDEHIVAHFSRELAHDDGGGEGDDLREKEGEEQSRCIESEGIAEGSRHIDDGVHAVDIEEEGDEVEDDAFFVGDIRFFGKDGEEAFEVIAQGVGGARNEVLLTVALHEGHCEAQPPDGVDDKRDGNGDGHIEARKEHDDDADEEGDTAADIAEGVALGGYDVGAFGSGDVHEHGVVEDKASRIEDLCDDEHDEEDEPRHGDSERGAADDADDGKEKEDGAFIAGKVAQGPQDGADDGDAQGHDTCGVSPVGGGKFIGDALCLGEPVEVNGQDGTDEQGKRGVSHVV